MPSMLPPKGFGKSFTFWPVFANPFVKFPVDAVDTSITILADIDRIDLRGKYPIFSLNQCQSNIRRRAANVTSNDPCSIRRLEGIRQIFATGLRLRQIDSNFRVWREIRRDCRAKVFEVSLGSGAPLGNQEVSIFLTSKVK